MTVTLTGAYPEYPTQGEDFEITATNGVPPYTFNWRAGDEGNWETVENGSNPKLKIKVPSGTTGEMLRVNVTDGDDNQDNYARRIVVGTGGEPD